MLPTWIMPEKWKPLAGLVGAGAGVSLLMWMNRKLAPQHGRGPLLEKPKTGASLSKVALGAGLEMAKTRVLQFLYGGAAVLSSFMVFWILSSATFTLGFDEARDAKKLQLLEKVAEQGKLPVPISLVMKYAGHKAIQFTHILPGAVWAAAVPIQLHPGIRKTYRKFHRCVGYAFFGATFLMAIGFALIEKRGLNYLHHDFPSVPLGESTSALGLGWVSLNLVFRGTMALFALFAGLSLRSAIRRDFASHQKWIYRHVGAGLWIALQRMYVGVVFAKTPREQKAAFGDGAMIGIVITMLSAELAVWLNSQPKSVKPRSEKDRPQ